MIVNLQCCIGWQISVFTFQISYIRNVVNNQLLPNIDTKPSASLTPSALNATIDHKTAATAALAKKTLIQKAAEAALKSNSLPTVVASEAEGGIAKEAVSGGQ